jgi:sulfur relay protein TusB/DsrH
VRVLHVLRSPGDRRALETAHEHALEHSCSLLLLQDAVLAPAADFPGRVYASAEDLAARGVETRCEELTYQQIVQLIFAHDRVITW